MAFCIKCGTKLVGENQPNGNATEGTAANANTASANPNANNGNIGVNVNNGTNGNVNANNGTNGNANRYNTPNYVAPNRQNYIPIYIMGGFLIAVIIICTTIIIVALTGGSLIVFDDGTQTTTQVSAEGETVEGETEAVAEGETEAVEDYTEAPDGYIWSEEAQTWVEAETEAVEDYTSAEEETEAAESNGEPYDYESAIYTLIAGAYGSGWVQTTNTHDTSYMLNYTTSSAQAFTLLGQRYWQERPYVTFNYIKNIQVYKVQREYEGYYTVYISYDFDLYNSANGERVIKTEMAIDKVQWDGSKYILSEHHWNQDVAQGTYITINTFK
jgi:hypothetical protein